MLFLSKPQSGIPPGYEFGYADAEKRYAPIIDFANSYIQLLEKQVELLTKQLNECRGECRGCDSESQP